jgi:hypothetical protein
LKTLNGVRKLRPICVAGTLLAALMVLSAADICGMRMENRIILFFIRFSTIVMVEETACSIMREDCRFTLVKRALR